MIESKTITWCCWKDGEVFKPCFMLAKTYNKMTETVQLCLVLQAIEWESAVLVWVFFSWKGRRRVSEMKLFMYIEIMCVSWCFLRWFLIIFTYLCVMHIVFQELVVFFCSGLFFNGIRSGCCPDVNCIRAWGLEENMYHKQTRWIRGGNGGARHVTYRGEEPRATSTVMATLPAVHIHYSEYIGLSFTLHTTSRLFIRHVLVKGKNSNTAREDDI